MDMRARFEAWASDNGAWPQAIEKRNGQYVYMGTVTKWETWKAAIAAHKDSLGEEQPIQVIQTTPDNTPNNAI